MPFLVVFVALRGIVDPWVVWASGALAHFQSFVSPLLACQKHDIRVAVLEFWCCYKETEDSKDNKDQRRANRNIRITGLHATVCQGSFPIQREDFAFSDETHVENVGSQTMEFGVPHAIDVEKSNEMPEKLLSESASTLYQDSLHTERAITAPPGNDQEDNDEVD